MKNQIKKALQLAGLNTHKAWAEQLGKNHKNFYREFKTKIEQLNKYLEPLNLEIKIVMKLNSKRKKKTH